MNSPRQSPHRHYTSRTFWTFFFSYVVLLTTLITIMAAFSWYGTVQRVKRETALKTLEDSRSVSCQLNEELQKLVTNTQQLRQVSWVHKLYSGAAAFDSYFDANRRREILLEMPFYLSNSSIVMDMALLFPERNVCVSTKGWLSLDEYLRLLSIPETQQAAVLADIRSSLSLQESPVLEESLSSNTLVLTAPLENIPQPRAYICYLVSLRSLRETSARMMPDSMLSLCISRSDGSPILTSGVSSASLPSDAVRMSYPGALLGWKYQYAFSSSTSTIPADEFFTLLGLYVAFFLAGILLSYLLSILTYRPLGRVLSRISQHSSAAPSDSHLSDYRIIENSFETLEEENLRMKASAEQYEKMVRTDVVKQLLKGYFDQDAIQRDLARYRIPFSAASFYQVLVLSGAGSDSARMEPYTAVELMNGLHNRLNSLAACQHELVESMDGDLIAVLAFSSQESSAQIGAAFVRELIALCTPYFAQRPLISVGGLHEGFIGISVSYHFAVDQRSHLPRSWEFAFSDDSASCQYYYPLEWETQLISSLKAGNHASADRILEELRRENRRLKPAESDGSSSKAGVKLISMILETLLRVTSELSINDRLFMEDLDVVFTNEPFDRKWECLHSISAQICSLAVREKEAPASSLGQDLVAYVDEHFRDSNLCLKTLGDRFSLSIQSISKLFKATADDTFYNYLYHKRMKYACELLRTTDATMQNIAKQIGYENEFSFKRAFIRYTGTRPKDFMENNRRP